MVERNADAEHIRDRRLLAVYGVFSPAKKRPENANKVLISAVLVGVVVIRRWGTSRIRSRRR
jgi:hypothetical protein